MTRSPIPCPWLRELAAGYLREYTSVSAQRAGGRWGYLFARRFKRHQLGFFVGFLTPRPRGASAPASTPRQLPACAVIAFVHPAASRLHQRLVRHPGSPFRRSYELLSKYTARRPRFEFQEREAAALLRRVPLAEFPARQRQKYARNFFVESLALLVRSGLPKALAEVRPASPGRSGE